MIEKLHLLNISASDYSIVPDDKLLIQEKINSLVAASYQMILVTGGTGLSGRDVTPEAVAELLEREIPGIAETARQYGQERIPTAMLSRSAGGLIGHTLVITMPGSTGGVTEYMDALFPQVLHVFSVMEGNKH